LGRFKTQHTEADNILLGSHIQGCLAPKLAIDSANAINTSASSGNGDTFIVISSRFDSGFVFGLSADNRNASFR
jgi:hypothetical protein